MKTKYWIIIFIVVIIAALAVQLFLLRSGTSDTIATIYQDRIPIATFSLEEVEYPHEFVVTTEDGNKNIVLVETGQISVRYATCPDQICVMQGPISNSVRPIVCLPHRLSIEITDAQDEDVDIVAGM